MVNPLTGVTSPPRQAHRIFWALLLIYRYTARLRNLWIPHHD